MNKLIALEKIQNASQNLSGVVINSAFEKVESYSAIYRSNIFFKREDLQKVRSFKIRGAYNKIISLRARKHFHTRHSVSFSHFMNVMST